ncbi:MAG: DUF1653 domain-containing protein [Candidatus Pacebacteria bacterium]|nr:DUF1653 domain-containing protein [Candidatus Paceibacterota bacterium]
MKCGTYRHYKGKYYQVIEVAKHSETLEEYVTYYCLYPNENGQLWIRPVKMFIEHIEVDGKKVPRFEFVKE